MEGCSGEWRVWRALIRLPSNNCDRIHRPSIPSTPSTPSIFLKRIIKSKGKMLVKGD